jgi:hypothetical protein
MKIVPNHVRFEPVSGIVGLEVIQVGDNGKVQVKVFDSLESHTDRLVGKFFWVPGRLRLAKVRFSKPADEVDDPLFVELQDNQVQIEIGDRIFGRITDNYPLKDKKTGKIHSIFFVHCVGVWSNAQNTFRQLEGRIQREEEQGVNIVHMNDAFQKALPLKKVASVAPSQITQTEGAGEPKRKIVPKAPRKKAKPAGNEEERVQATA